MEAETDVQSFSGYQAQLEEYLNLPLLPRNEQDQILRLFEKADIEGRGHLFIDELVANQIVPDDLADAVLKPVLFIQGGRGGGLSIPVSSGRRAGQPLERSFSAVSKPSLQDNMYSF